MPPDATNPANNSEKGHSIYLRIIPLKTEKCRVNPLPPTFSLVVNCPTDVKFLAHRLTECGLSRHQWLNSEEHRKLALELGSYQYEWLLASIWGREFTVSAQVLPLALLRNIHDPQWDYSVTHQVLWYSLFHFYILVKTFIPDYLFREICIVKSLEWQR